MASDTQNVTNLIDLAQHGNRNAFSELVQSHYPAVISVVYRICGDAQLAQDAAQETFIKAWQHLSSYRPGTSLRSWLYRIAINSAVDMLRCNSHVNSVDLEDIQLHDDQPGPEVILSAKQQTQLVQRAVMSLPPASRAVLVLREYEQLSYQEIADALEIPVGTVMSRLNYARQRLKESLKPELMFVEVEYA